MILEFQLYLRQGNQGVYPTEQGFKYEYESLKEEVERVAPKKKTILWRKSKKISYLNVPCSFDIETTSWYENEDKKATMYVYVFGFNGKVFVGRTWEQATKMFKLVTDTFQCNSSQLIICYVHNLSYEFQFFRKIFQWTSVFATDQRTPIKCVTSEGVCFKDSLALSGYSLAKVAEHLTTYKVAKMVGDLDYRLKRNIKTPLTPKEWGYVFNDGLVVMAFIREEMERNHNNITKIPLTKTGYVRRFMRNECLYASTSHKKDKNHKYIQYRDLMSKLTLNIEENEYDFLKQAFQGGFTHANAFNCSTTIENVTSMDFTSSYPSVLVSEMFPMGKSQIVYPKNHNEFDKYINEYCCLFYIEFNNIVSNDYGDNPISFSKCLETNGEEIDNGRVHKATFLSMVITEVDYQVYQYFYSWNKIKVGKMFIYRKAYLPTDFVKGVLNLYNDKTTLKGIEGMEAEYMHSKENLNSCYGMCVTDFCRDEISYEDDIWELIKCVDKSKQIEKYNNDKQRFLSYTWGVWCTAYARKNLFSAIYAMRGSGDYIYSDTDSVKVHNIDKHMKYFKWYNDNHRKKLELAMKHHKLDMSMVEPKTIKGTSKLIGVWDFDGHYLRFKTLGAKRYISEDDGYNLHITISGVNKKCGIDFLKWKYKTNDNIFSHFEQGLTFDGEYKINKEIKEGCGKKILTYIDDEQGGTLIDYLGNKANWYELSSVHMEATSYTMSLSQDFIDFLQEIKGAMYTNVN